MRDMSRVGVGAAGESTKRKLSERKLTSTSILAGPKRCLSMSNTDVKRL